MKLLQLAAGDKLYFDRPTKVPLDTYYSDDALEEIGILDDAQIEEFRRCEVTTIELPAGTVLQLYDTDSSLGHREDCRVRFYILEWPPFLITDRRRIMIPIDDLNRLEISRIETFPIDSRADVLRKDDEEDEDIDPDDFSHIK